jgi:hypothetical protein
MPARYPGDRITSVYPLSAQISAEQIQSMQIVFQGETVHANVGRTTAEQIWDVPGDAIDRWITGVLGYGVSKGAGNGIARQLPARHPLLKYLWVSDVQCEGIGSFGQDGAQAKWKRWRTKLIYDTPPYAVLPDGEAPLEYMRFLAPGNIISNSEVFQRRQGTFAYTAWSGLGVSGGLNALRIPESHGASQVVTKTSYEFLWVQVPDRGLFGAGGADVAGFGSSSNIINGLGTVNDDYFMNFKPGTLLFESWRPISRTYPIEPEFIGLLPGHVPRSWDVMLRFIHFDPPSGMVENYAGAPFEARKHWPPAALYGHNLVPHPTNGYWYLAYLSANFQNDETEPQFWRYRPYDFRKIFQMNA